MMLKLITKYRSVKGTILNNKENKRKPTLFYVPQRIKFPKIGEVRLLLLQYHYVAFVNPLLSYLYLLLNLSPRLANGGITNEEY